MAAFAANSILTRLALADGDAGAWTFAVIRVGTGAMVLALLMRGQAWGQGSWRGAIALLAYAVFFSYAYLAMSAGAGALVLFAVVQITMLSWGIKQGERLSLLQWTGLVAALGALVWLLSPGLDAPPLFAALAMSVAGVGWGIYSLMGRGATQPTATTTGNFLRAGIIVAAFSPAVLLVAPEAMPTPRGLGAAVASGALASGLGYALWYAVLPSLRASQASVMQLTVPVLAAAGGVLFLAEPLTMRFVVSSIIILTGVAIVTLTRPLSSPPDKSL